MEKDFRKWPGGFPIDVNDELLGDITPLLKPSLPRATTENQAPIQAQSSSSVKQIANDLDAKAREFKPQQPTRWDQDLPHRRREQQPESNIILRSMDKAYTMIRGPPPPSQEAERALQEQYEVQLATLAVWNDELQEEVHELTRKLDSHKSEYQKKLRKEYEESDNLIKKAKQNHQQELNKREKGYETELDRIKKLASERIESSKKHAAAVENKCKESEQTCKECEKHIETLEASTSKMQAAQLSSVEATQWAPLAISDIEHQLKGILSRVRQWGIEYSKLTIEHVLETNHFDAIAQALKRRGCLKSTKGLRAGITKSKVMQKPGKASALLLSAMASFDIMQTIIGDPFFAFVGEETEGGVLGVRHGESLNSMLKVIRQGDEGGAEALRCQLLRLLDPPGEAIKALQLTKAITKDSRTKAVTILAQAFMSDACKSIEPDRLTDALLAMEAIMEDAAQMSWTFWTRKARIEVPDFSRLLTDDDDTLVYHSKAPGLAAHSQYNVKLEDEPKALDSAEVLLVCSPLVLAVGNAEGKDYDKPRLLKKAVAWMG